MAKHVYIHIPFCNKLCSYCSFTKFLYDDRLVNDYFDYLEKEVKDLYQNEEINTIYIGGGTPSSLSLDYLNRLFDICDLFNKSNDLEFTIEVNPDTSFDKIKLMHDRGCNRLSIGIETINDKYYKDINRFNNKDNINNLITFAKKYFNNINVDLIYGFNNENMNDLNNDLDYILGLNTDHISIYALQVEEHTKLYLNNYNGISDDLLNKMYYYIDKKLVDAGFDHYEISNYAKNNRYSRHNNAYWKNKEYYGFGIGASSYLNGTRITNTSSINNYKDRNKRILDRQILSKKDKMEYEMILGLRLKKGINLDDFKNKYLVDPIKYFNIEDLINDNYLIINNGYLYMPKEYYFVENKILERFVD